MGCGQSCQMNQEVTPADPGMLDEFMALDRTISREEADAPGPALSHALVRQDLLQTQVEAAEERLQRFRRTDASDESLLEVLVQLNVDRNVKVALEHEEFIGNINRQALAKNELDLLMRRAEEAEEETKIISAKVTYLQSIYQQQDEILAGVLSEAYGASEEVLLERELDKLRSYRDTLAGGALEWQEASAHVHVTTELMERAVHCWKVLDSQTMESRFHLATEARNAIQEAAIGVQTAQDLLSGVQFPYCTTREVTAVLQAIVYIFTDIQVPDRFEHAGLCYTNFHQRALALAEWMDMTIEHSLKKDLDDVDRQVNEATSRLRNMRIALIRNKTGESTEASIQTASTQGNVPIYPGEERLRSQPYGYETKAFQQLDHSVLFPVSTQQLTQNKGTNSKLMSDFKRNLASRSHMWTSRRVEEMQMNYINQPQPRVE